MPLGVRGPKMTTALLDRLTHHCHIKVLGAGHARFACEVSPEVKPPAAANTQETWRRRQCERRVQ
jgi:hypothetical protein